MPLIMVGNVRRFETSWPLPANGKPQGFLVTDTSRKLLLPAKNYVLLRRFSAKEERRRLTASCFIGHQFDATEVAVENHVNYVYHAERDLTKAETFGLAALFNSFLLDQYFRTLSGNTQVNASELRSMPFSRPRPHLGTWAAHPPVQDAYFREGRGGRTRCPRNRRRRS